MFVSKANDVSQPQPCLHTSTGVTWCRISSTSWPPAKKGLPGGCVLVEEGEAQWGGLTKDLLASGQLGWMMEERPQREPKGSMVGAARFLGSRSMKGRL